MTSTIREWSYPTRVIFGEGASQGLAGYCSSLGIMTPLLVTDPGLARSDMVASIITDLGAGGVDVTLYSGVQSNPTAADIDEGAKVFENGRHDGVIAFGGGSALDAGKAIAFMSVQSRPIWDFEDIGDNWTRATAVEVAPIIAVPTTAGTGSEVGRASVVTNLETHVKKIIFHPSMMPKIALLDPEMTRGLPAHLTAATGFDAFVHCLEAFCAPGFHPMADGIALEGMRLIANALPRAVADGDDMEARADMIVAASMGATAFQKGLGGVHALSHAVGALHNTHHGLTNAILLPFVMQANRSAIEEKTDRIARYLGLEQPGYDAVFSFIQALRAQIGIPPKLSELISETVSADVIGPRAVEDPTAAGNPIRLSANDYAEIYTRAVEGRL